MRWKEEMWSCQSWKIAQLWRTYRHILSFYPFLTYWMKIYKSLKHHQMRSHTHDHICSLRWIRLSSFHNQFSPKFIQKSKICIVCMIFRMGYTQVSARRQSQRKKWSAFSNQRISRNTFGKMAQLGVDCSVFIDCLPSCFYCCLLVLCFDCLLQLFKHWGFMGAVEDLRNLLGFLDDSLQMQVIEQV